MGRSAGPRRYRVGPHGEDRGPPPVQRGPPCGGARAPAGAARAPMWRSAGPRRCSAGPHVGEHRPSPVQRGPPWEGVQAPAGAVRAPMGRSTGPRRYRAGHPRRRAGQASPPRWLPLGTIRATGEDDADHRVPGGIDRPSIEGKRGQNVMPSRVAAVAGFLLVVNVTCEQNELDGQEAPEGTPRGGEVASGYPAPSTKRHPRPPHTPRVAVAVGTVPPVGCGRPGLPLDVDFENKWR
jgi:hypothetical protein